jgi:ABC-type lipoprotein release transport system permease subunit
LKVGADPEVQKLRRKVERPFDPLLLVLAEAFVLLLALLASLLPARRAASLDLISVLRAE